MLLHTIENVTCIKRHQYRKAVFKFPPVAYAWYGLDGVLETECTPEIKIGDKGKLEYRSGLGYGMWFFVKEKNNETPQ